MTLTIGSLCAGYGGLDMAAAILWPDTTVEWFAENNDDPAKVMARHHPDTPNLGDLTNRPERFTPVDIITAGFPCQPASVAGSRRGVNDNRWIWPHIATIINRARPAVVMLENVPGLLTVNDGAAFDEVVNDLTRLGYCVDHTIVAAGLKTPTVGDLKLHVGAAHRRARLFILAHRDGIPRMADASYLNAADDSPVAHLLPTPNAAESDPTPGMVDAMAAAGIQPSQRLYMPGRTWHSQRTLSRVVGALLPTPASWDGSRGPDLARANRPDSGGPDLTTAVERLLPTPTTTDATGSRNATLGRPPADGKNHNGWTLTDVAFADTFGDYTDAITRHTEHLGRTPPNPHDHAHRLSPRFVEWLMMLPPGHVTDTNLDPYEQPLLFDDLEPRPERHRRAYLAMLGNGVVPPQAALAYHHLATRPT